MEDYENRIVFWQLPETSVQDPVAMYEEVFELFRSIRTRSVGGKSSRHKPLLLLFAMARLRQGQTSMSFDQVEDELVRLLDKYGTGTVPRPEYPFVRLVSDGLGQLQGLPDWKPNTDYTRKRLRESKVRGGFANHVQQVLNDEAMYKLVALHLLVTFFADVDIHGLIAEIGLEG